MAVNKESSKENSRKHKNDLAKRGDSQGIIQLGIDVAPSVVAGEVHDDRPVARGQDARAGRYQGPLLEWDQVHALRREADLLPGMDRPSTTRGQTCPIPHKANQLPITKPQELHVYVTSWIRPCFHALGNNGFAGCGMQVHGDHAEIVCHHVLTAVTESFSGSCNVPLLPLP